MLIFYNLFITLYSFAVRLAALKNEKAKKWIVGRRTWEQDLKTKLDNNHMWIWVHCASAGEFEQGKPVIEQLKATYPSHKVLVSFFSPSGYQSGLKYKGADHICYLPLDTKRNAQRFLTIANPQLVVFVKYDYWYHHLKAVADRGIPLLLVSAIFRDSQPFFHWYGGLHQQMLHFFSHVFVQDTTSQNLLQTIDISHSTVSGDTRFDRVATIAGNFTALEKIEAFIGKERAIIAGSTWPEDEQMLQAATAEMPDLKLVIAPHEIHAAHIDSIMQLFPDAIKYSELSTDNYSDKSVLIIDNVGMLSRLYHYATLTYIGGGFNKSGIHNTLEAAVWGKPVLFGPNYQKFKEARDLVDQRAAFSVNNANELKSSIQNLFNHRELAESSVAAKAYVQQQQGATITILHYIQENRLLTN